MARRAINELSTLAKFISNELLSKDPNDHPNQEVWKSIDPIPMFFEEVVPAGVTLLNRPAGMFILTNSDNIKGNFGKTLYRNDTYEIKGIVEGTDFSLIEAHANAIEYTFDWEHQEDPDAGRPKSQQTYTDPDHPDIEIMIMSILRVNLIKYATFDENNGLNYCHLGGEYEIEYYRL